MARRRESLVFNEYHYNFLFWNMKPTCKLLWIKKISFSNERSYPGFSGILKAVNHSEFCADWAILPNALAFLLVDPAIQKFLNWENQRVNYTYLRSEKAYLLIINYLIIISVIILMY